MTAATLILPYRRTTPYRIPKRDLAIGAADSLRVRISVVESDLPDAPALVITGGVGGPALRFMIWADWRHGGGWGDYGRGVLRRGDLLWSAQAAVNGGAFDVTMPANQVDCWPRRCGFSAQLDWDGGTHSELLCQGALHILRGWYGAMPQVPILTDSGDEILLA
jgi:hypothetical protein